MFRGRALYTHDRDHSATTQQTLDPAVAREYCGKDTDKIFGALGASAAGTLLFTPEEVFGSTSAVSNTPFPNRPESTRWAPAAAKTALPPVPVASAAKPKPALPTPPAGAAAAMTAQGLNKAKPLPTPPAKVAKGNATPTLAKKA